MPEQLRKRVLEYYAYCNLTQPIGTHWDLAELPSHLRLELVMHRYRNVISRVVFFTGLRHDVVEQICLRFHDYTAMAGEDIFEEGDWGHELIVVQRGRARAHRMESEAQAGGGSDAEDYWEFIEGDFFGELEFLGLRDRRHFTIEAVTHCELSALNLEDLAPLRTVFSSLQARFLAYEKLRSTLEQVRTGASIPRSRGTDTIMS